MSSGVTWRASRWVPRDHGLGWKVTDFYDYPNGGWREAVEHAQRWHDPEAIERGLLRVRVDPL